MGVQGLLHWVRCYPLLFGGPLVLKSGDHVTVDAAALAHFLALASSADLASIIADDGLGMLDRYFGGEYAELAQRVASFAQKLTECGIRATYILDGHPAALKEGTHSSRRESLLAECSHAVHSNVYSLLRGPIATAVAVRSEMRKASRRAPKPLFLVEAAAAALAKSGADIVVAASEGDRAVAYVAKLHESRCILSNDSDFLVYDSAPLMPLDSVHFSVAPHSDAGGDSDKVSYESSSSGSSALSRTKPRHGGTRAMHGLALHRSKLLRVLRVPSDALSSLALLTGCDYSPMATVDLAWMHGAMHAAIADHTRWLPRQQQQEEATTTTTYAEAQVPPELPATSSSSSSSFSSSAPVPPASVPTAVGPSGEPAKQTAAGGSTAAGATEGNGMDKAGRAIDVGRVPDRFHGRVCNAKQALELASAYLRAFWPPGCYPLEGMYVVIACLSRGLRRHPAIAPLWVGPREQAEQVARENAQARRAMGSKRGAVKVKHRGKGKKRRTEADKPVAVSGHADSAPSAPGDSSGLADRKQEAIKTAMDALSAVFGKKPKIAIATDAMVSGPGISPTSGGSSGSAWLLGSLRATHDLLLLIHDEYTDFGAKDVMQAASAEEALQQLCQTCVVHPDRLAWSLALPALLSEEPVMQARGRAGRKPFALGAYFAEALGSLQFTTAESSKLDPVPASSRPPSAAAPASGTGYDAAEVVSSCRAVAAQLVAAAPYSVAAAVEAISAGSLLGWRCLQQAVDESSANDSSIAKPAMKALLLCLKLAALESLGNLLESLTPAHALEAPSEIAGAAVTLATCLAAELRKMCVAGHVPYVSAGTKRIVLVVPDGVSETTGAVGPSDGRVSASSAAGGLVVEVGTETTSTDPASMGSVGGGGSFGVPSWCLADAVSCLTIGAMRWEQVSRVGRKPSGPEVGCGGAASTSGSDASRAVDGVVGPATAEHADSSGGSDSRGGSSAAGCLSWALATSSSSVARVLLGEVGNGGLAVASSSVAKIGGRVKTAGAKRALESWLCAFY